MMNMTQLAFIKRLDCVERVRTDEGLNPFLEEEALAPETVNPEAISTAQVMTLASDEPVAIAAEPVAVIADDTTAANDGIAVACVGGSSSSCSCPTNKDMASAKEIKVETLVSGKICCPGAEQWFKFTVPQTASYTIYTTGSLDTVGALYDCCGNLMVEIDDYAQCGKINFRIIRYLTANVTYYLRVTEAKSDTGSYSLKVTQDKLVNYVTVSPSTIVLEKGKSYELPITPNYAYLNLEGTERIKNLSVSLSPAKAAEQLVYWYGSGRDVISTESGWLNGQRYQKLNVLGDGTATLYAYDWDDHGKRGECTIHVPKVTVISCSPEAWVVSSKTMGNDMATAFNSQGGCIVRTPTNADSFDSCWNNAGECMIIHTHGSPVGLFDHGGDGSTPVIISKANIKNLTKNNKIKFIMMTACETAGGTSSDNVAYWLSKKINSNGIVIANTDIVSGNDTSFHGSSNNQTWKVYKDGIVQNIVLPVTLTMSRAYDIYKSFQ
jgi:hypothetical protein